MGIYFKGTKLGFSKAVTSYSGDNYRVDSRVYFRLSTAGIDQITSFTQEVELDSNLKIKSFSLLQEINASRHLTIARRVGNAFSMKISSAGFNEEKLIPFDPEATLSSTFGLNIISGGLEVGRKGRLPIFLEAFRTFSEVKYEIQGRQKIYYNGDFVNAFVIHNVVAGMESTLWVAPNGKLLREVSQDGFESLAESPKKAQDLGDEAVSINSLITMSLVKPQGEIKNPRNLRFLKVRLLNLRARTSVQEDQRQKLVEVEKVSGGWEATLTINSEAQEIIEKGYKESFIDPAMLEDTSEIQSKNPMIQALAKKISFEKKDAWQIVQAINDWVYLNMEKALVDTLTATDALIELKGECQAHANLFVALSRAAGIPARVVSGLVYSSEYKGFLYHAWAEVYVNGWRAMDPTFGQNLVDATHIKLGVRDQQNPLNLMEFVGKLQIQLLDF